MASTSTALKANLSKAPQPDSWKKYSTHGECPISFVGSVLLHVLVLLCIVRVVVWEVDRENENSKPPLMDMVEVVGGGGGLGGDGAGPGKATDLTRTEGPANDNQKPSAAPAQIAEIKLKELTDLSELKLQVWDDSAEAKDGDLDAFLKRERELGEKMLAYDRAKVEAKSGGGGGGAPAGTKGSGLGNKIGPPKGNALKGATLTDQRRRELRWKILASDDGDVHLKKLKALRVILMIPVRERPGSFMRYDLSKGSLQGQLVQAQDDPNKVRWRNGDPKEMLALAKALRLNEPPPYSVIYLPSDLEADMAKRELDYKGLRENEILMTVWDLVQRDGVYDNEPQIVEQIARPGVKK